MKSISLFISIVVIHASVVAQKWDIRLDKGIGIEDITPTELTSDSLRFKLHNGGSGGAALSGITGVKYREKESKAGQGFVIGCLSGAALGFMVGMIADHSPESDPFRSDESNGNLKVILPLVGGGLGGIIGYAVGNGSGIRSVDMSLLSTEEKHETLSDLLDRSSTGPKSSGARRANRSALSLDDVLYLKNGSIIHGSVMELVPDSTVKIMTSDSSVFVFKLSEVDKLVKEQTAVVSTRPKLAYAPSTPSGNGDERPFDEMRPVRYGLNIGVGFPTGDFASTTSSSGGRAKAGLMLGGDVEYRFSQNVSCLGSLSIGLNSPDMNTSGLDADISQWTTVWPMVGVRVYPPASPSVAAYAQGRVGILFGTYPGISISSGGQSFSEESASSSSVAFSVGAGLVIDQKVNIGLNYLYGNPEYELTAVMREGLNATTQRGKIKQSTGMIQLSAGVIF